jgi:hypothetical protein
VLLALAVQVTFAQGVVPLVATEAGPEIETVIGALYTRFVVNVAVAVEPWLSVTTTLAVAVPFVLQ